MGFPHVSTWRALMVFDRTLGGQGHPWCHWWPYFTHLKIVIPKKFCQYLHWKGIKNGGLSYTYVEDVEGCWQETLQTWSSLMSLVTIFNPKIYSLTFLCQYINYKCVRKEGPLWWCVEDVDCSWQKTWRKELSLISWVTLFDPNEGTLKLLFQEFGIIHEGTWGCCGLLTWDLGGHSPPW